MEKTLTVEDIARNLTVQPETVRRWLRTGLLKGSRPSGGAWTVLEADFKRFKAPAQQPAPAILKPQTENYGIYALVSLKGGVGKTTSAMHLAAVAYRLGLPVVVLDADNEHSAYRWAATATRLGTPLPFEVIESDQLELASQARAMSQTHVVVIDTPPNDHNVLTQASGVSDACIVPLAPSALEADRLISTLKLLRSVEAIVPTLNVSVLITRYNAGTQLAKDIHGDLARFPVLNTTVRDLERYKKSFGLPPAYLEEYQNVWVELHEKSLA